MSTKLSSSHFLTIILAISQSQLASSATTTTTKVPRKYTNFIKTKCSTATYSTLCLKTLTPYASKVRTDTLTLCKTALNVAVQGASKASIAVSQLAKQRNISRFEAAAIKDCIEDMKDAVYELKQTVDAMGHLGDADKKFQWANANTWAMSQNVKNKVRGNVQNAATLTSNALFLINHLY
ncbi:hypothetical protein LIER_43899 [Lithospermum erythrorhizon]|uniref:Pectinesterase inhibitor domain-containing protein n=1 Tax=Lithospermum erythrorhizon TaxID=34254 RepID=A0AAV3R803_LITER